MLAIAAVCSRSGVVSVFTFRLLLFNGLRKWGVFRGFLTNYYYCQIVACFLKQIHLECLPKPGGLQLQEATLQVCRANTSFCTQLFFHSLQPPIYEN